MQVLFKVFSGLKPEVPADMPAGYRALMEDCWDKDNAKRPTFKAILPRLQTLLAEAIGPSTNLTCQSPSAPCEGFVSSPREGSNII